MILSRKVIFPIVLIIIIVAIIVYNGSSPQYIGAENITEMQKIDSFPGTNEKIYLSNAVNFSFSSSHIFISDQYTSAIYVFDYEGNFVRKIGREGKGPNELLNPHNIFYTDHKLFVNDQGNSRFQVFNLESSKSHVYPVRGNFYSFVVSEDNLISYLSYHPAERSRLDSLHLLKVYDLELNRTGSLGNFLRITENIVPDASFPLLEIVDNKLFLLFKAYPYLHIYNLNTLELDTTINFKNKNNYYDLIKNNYDSKTFANPFSRNLQTLFNSFDVNESGFFLNIYNEEKIIIDHYDIKGNFKQRYINENVGESFYIKDIKIVKDNNKLLAYLLISDGEDKINIYKLDEK